MNMWVRHRAGERGAVFLLAIVILTVLLFLGASLIERAESNLARATTDNRSAQSFHRAEAGIDKAVYELKLQDGWHSYNGETGVTLGQGRYDVTVSPPASGRVSHAIATIDAVGYERPASGERRFPRRIRVLLKRNETFPFKYAIASQTAADIGNSQIDSYHSEEGPYGGANVHSNASVAVNTTQYVSGSGGVAIGAQGVLNGNIVVGAGTTNLAAAVSSQGSFTGAIKKLDQPMVFAPVIVPANAVDLGDR